MTHISVLACSAAQQYFQYADVGLHYALAKLTGESPLDSLTHIVDEGLALARLAMVFIEECLAKVLIENFSQEDLKVETVDLGKARPFDAIVIPCFTAPAQQTEPPLMPFTVRLPPPQ